MAMSRLNSSITQHGSSRVSTGTSSRDPFRSKMNSARQPRTRDMENFIIVWLNLYSNEFDNDSLDQLRQIINSIKKFIHPEPCFDYLASVKDEKIFMISSYALDRPRMSRLDELSQLHSIYFLSDEKFEYQAFKKVKGIYKNIEQICDEMKRELHQSQTDLTPISLISSHSIRHLNELDQSFMYAQLIKEILLDIHYDDNAKADFIEFCRVQYADNRHELQIIDEFERDYDRPSPVWWYTRDCFTFSMLNKALRTQDTEVIIKMGFFIRDLHRQIEQLYSQMDKAKTFVVYRGQRMLNLQFAKLLQSKGGLLSFNNFVATSTDRQFALNFLQQSRENRHVTSILFQIDIPPSTVLSPFVSTDQISSDAHTHDEILFSLHTILRIGEIKQIDDRLWQVNLTMPNTDDEQVRRLTDYTGQVTREEVGMHRMAKLMIVMDKIDKAQEIYSALLETTAEDDEKELAHLHHQLGYIDEQNGDLDSALAHYEQSLGLHLSYLSVDDPQLCSTYSNIGLILKRQGNLDGALEYFQQALGISLVVPNPSQLEIAIRYNHLGGVFHAQGKWTEALENYEHALEIEHVHLPAHHPLLGATHQNIGLVYYSMTDYPSALIHFSKTLEIERQSLSSDHPSLLMTHANLTGVLEHLHQYKEAIEHAEKALDIVHNAFSIDDPQVLLWQGYLNQLREKQWTMGLVFFGKINTGDERCFTGISRCKTDGFQRDCSRASREKPTQ